MKKTTVITLAMIITMVSYAQKPFDTAQEVYRQKIEQRMEKQRQVAKCPLSKRKAQIVITTNTEVARQEALEYARKTQDVELEDSLMAINTSDTIHTLFVFKYMLTEMKNKYDEMVINGYTSDEVRSVYKTCDYIKAVLNDYLDDMQNKNNDIAFYQKEDRIEFIYDLLIEVKTVWDIYDIIHRFRRAA